MAEAPLAKLARVLGGVALSYGALGHQILGQLITLNSKEVELAAAATVIAATSRQPHAGVHALVRVLAPAVAVHLLTRSELERLGRVSQRLDEKQQRLQQREAALGLRGRTGPSFSHGLGPNGGPTGAGQRRGST